MCACLECLNGTTPLRNSEVVEEQTCDGRVPRFDCHPLCSHIVIVSVNVNLYSALLHSASNSTEYFWNRYDFSRRPKLAMLRSGSRRSLLTEFQTVGPTVVNARRPYVSSCILQAVHTHVPMSANNISLPWTKDCHDLQSQSSQSRRSNHETGSVT